MTQHVSQAVYDRLHKEVIIVKADGTYWNPAHPGIHVRLWFTHGQNPYYGVIDQDGDYRILAGSHILPGDKLGQKPHLLVACLSDFHQFTRDTVYQILSAASRVCIEPECPKRVKQWVDETLAVKRQTDKEAREQNETRLLLRDAVERQKRKKITVALAPDAKVDPNVMAWISDSLVWAVHKTLGEGKTTGYETYTLTHLPSGKMAQTSRDAYTLRFIMAHLDGASAQFCDPGLPEDEERLKALVVRINEARQLL